MRSHLLFLLAPALLAGCDKDTPSAGGAASASASGSSYGAPIGAPLSPEKVVGAVNPEKKQPYAGPKGRLKGTIRIEGDPPPDTGLKFPERCKESAAVYGKLFRVGLDKALADAMVSVVGYDAFVPAEGEAVKIPLHHCTPAKRTFTVTYGQRIDVFNLDTTGSYMPYLDGAGAKSIMVAIPRGDAVKLYPRQSPKLYMLRDQLDSGLAAHVFVLNYPTHDVTGLDGHYEIRNIPVGKARLAVLLPVIEKSEEREVEIKEGDNTLDVTLRFDAAKDLPKNPNPPASASAPASAGPAVPPSASASAAPKAPATARPR